MKSPAMMWDFWSLNPESLHQVTMLFSDRGTPDGYRHMDGFGSHTYSMINSAGTRVWCKWHLKTRQGIRNLLPEEAARLAGADPDHAQRDLFNAIAAGSFPRWNASVQIMTEADAARYHINPFDLTKVWPHKDYPRIPVGVLELNRNPVNYHAEVEQAAFSPANVVPGLGSHPTRCSRDGCSPTTMLNCIGWNESPVSAGQCARCPVQHHQRDGAMSLNAISDQRTTTIRARSPAPPHRIPHTQSRPCRCQRSRQTSMTIGWTKTTTHRQGTVPTGSGSREGPAHNQHCARDERHLTAYYRKAVAALREGGSGIRTPGR